MSWWRPRVETCAETLNAFTPAASPEEIHDAALQYVRKISGSTAPSAANQEAFDHAVEQVSQATADLLDSLVTNAPPRTRETEAARAKARSAKRFGPKAA